MSNLAAKKCVPCDAGTPPLSEEQAQKYLSQLGDDWAIAPSTDSTSSLQAGSGQGKKKVWKKFKFKTFKEAIGFVNNVASIAEEEGHHPYIIIRYNRVTIELTTHAIHGLSENDFIVADKIDVMYNLEEIVERFVISKLFTLKVVGTVVVILVLLLIFKKYF